MSGPWWRRALVVAVPVGALLSLVVAVNRLGEDTGGLTATTAPPLTAPAAEGVVERQLTLNAVVAWAPGGTVISGAAGVITSLTDQVVVAEGDTLLSVDLVDVVLAEGEVPMFRELRRGVDGPDVAQLQTMLGRAGFYDGDLDGVFDRTTERAVRQWQEGRRVATVGVVGSAELVFSEHLPARVAFDESTVLGGSVTPGEVIADLLDPEPRFEVPLQDAQTALVEAGMSVTLDVDGEELDAVVAGISVPSGEERAEPVLDLTVSEPCGQTCGSLGADGGERVPVTIDLVPRTSGVVVPSLALRRSADGGTVVELATGEVVPVEEVASAAGRSVVEGIEAGDEVVLAGGGS